MQHCLFIPKVLFFSSSSRCVAASPAAPPLSFPTPTRLGAPDPRAQAHEIVFGVVPGPAVAPVDAEVWLTTPLSLSVSGIRRRRRRQGRQSSSSMALKRINKELQDLGKSLRCGKAEVEEEGSMPFVLRSSTALRPERWRAAQRSSEPPVYARGPAAA